MEDEISELLKSEAIQEKMNLFNEGIILPSNKSKKKEKNKNQKPTESRLIKKEIKSKKGENKKEGGKIRIDCFEIKSLSNAEKQNEEDNNQNGNKSPSQINDQLPDKFQLNNENIFENQNNGNYLDNFFNLDDNEDKEKDKETENKLKIEENENVEDDPNYSGSENNLDESFNNENISNAVLNADSLKKRKKRRKKDEITNREYSCDLCDKAYLSYPALTNHKKNKHNNTSNNNNSVDTPEKEKKSRGRPKKSLIACKYLQEFQYRIRNFFDIEKRKRDEADEKDSGFGMSKVSDIEWNATLAMINQQVFEDIYQTHREYCYDQEIPNFDSHPILKMLYNSEETQTDNFSQTSKKTIDEAFLDFIKDCSMRTNQLYLKIIIKYLILLRESINKNHNDKSYTEREYSSTIPRNCNDFISFMTAANYFGMSSEEEQIDLIEFIQYFCKWLNTNKYTNLKMNLIVV